ncbi:hypothetical protein GCM10010252_69500 [Streptomyces aureoverticillatus]|nr:hypothetical protein GCM10010252_69500 [Streptomyces aureoverticillatus]
MGSTAWPHHDIAGSGWRLSAGGNRGFLLHDGEVTASPCSDGVTVTHVDGLVLTRSVFEHGVLAAADPKCRQMTRDLPQGLIPHPEEPAPL